MVKLRFRMLTFTASVLLAGCTSFRGPDPIYTNAGLPPEPVSRTQPAALYGLRAIFASDLYNAYSDREKNLISQPNINRMLSSGFALVHANCNQYFSEMGRNQRRSQVLRDLISPITTVLTGVLALQDFSNNPSRKEDILSVISLGSGAVASGLDIYDTRFLFGTDNISSVRTMTLNTVTAHRKIVLDAPPSEFVFAMTQLIDNQDICTPPQILTLVRESIKSAAPKEPKKDETDDGDQNESEFSGVSGKDRSGETANKNDHHPMSVTPDQ